jgi:hypothetical protein
MPLSCSSSSSDENTVLVGPGGHDLMTGVEGGGGGGKVLVPSR